jgi:hypothetical protein
MKHINLLLMVFVLLPILGWSALSTSFSPGSVEVNAMSTISFDPQEPLSQPMLTTLTITEDQLPAGRIDLKVVVYWNNARLVEADFESLDENWGSIISNKRQVQMSNRHLISEEGHPDFQPKGSSSISVEQVINANPTLKEAVLAGYFPDGNLELRIWVRNWQAGTWNTTSGSPAVFTIKIRNAGAINLISPGVVIGQTPPQISQRPISFQWNSVSTGFNKSSLVVREYPANNPPSQNNIENTGNLFYSNPDVNSGFSDFLAFNPGNYYAWQITTTLFNEFTIQNQNLQPKLKSNWFVFRFVNESQNTNETAAEMQAQLNILNNNALRSILAQGYTLVGTVIYEGRTYSGQDALDLLSGLAGKELQVQLRD